jgi:hypothetical protein
MDDYKSRKSIKLSKCIVEEVTLKNRFLPRRKRKCCYLVQDPVITLFE